MEAEKNLGKALLDQRSKEEVQHTDAERRKVMDKIRREERDLRILKRVLAIYCGLALLVFFALQIPYGSHYHVGDILRTSTTDLAFAVTGVIFIGAITFWPITILLAVGIYLKGRSVSGLQVQAKLLHLEEELRKLGEAKRKEG